MAAAPDLLLVLRPVLRFWLHRRTRSNPFAGFAVKYCEPLEFNGTSVVVTCAGLSDLSALAGRMVALEFRSNRTKLFSFRSE